MPHGRPICASLLAGVPDFDPCFIFLVSFVLFLDIGISKKQDMENTENDRFIIPLFGTAALKYTYIYIIYIYDSLMVS
jgi:hypothetical protein